MAFKKGDKKPESSGRKKGTPNKKDTMQEYLEKIVTEDGEPVDIVKLFFEGLMTMPPFQRVDALLELFQFVFPKKRNLDIGNNSESDGFKILIEDYSKK